MLLKRYFSASVKQGYLIASNIPSTVSLTSFQTLVDPENTKVSAVKPLRNIQGLDTQNYLLTLKSANQAEEIVNSWLADY